MKKNLSTDIFMYIPDLILKLCFLCDFYLGQNGTCFRKSNRKFDYLSNIFLQLVDI